jgi:hypothetical protein
MPVYPKTPTERAVEQLLFQITTDLAELRRLVHEDGQSQARAQARNQVG